MSTLKSFTQLLEKSHFYYNALTWTVSKDQGIVKVNDPEKVARALKEHLTQLTKNFPPSQRDELQALIDTIESTAEQVKVPKELLDVTVISQLTQGLHNINAQSIVNEQASQPIIAVFIDAALKGDIDFHDYVNATQLPEGLNQLFNQCKDKQSSDLQIKASRAALIQSLNKALLGDELQLKITNVAQLANKTSVTKEQLTSAFGEFTNEAFIDQLYNQLNIVKSLSSQSTERLDTFNQVLTQVLSDFIITNGDILSYDLTEAYFTTALSESTIKSFHLTAAVGSVVLSSIAIANRLRKDELSIKNLGLNFLDNGGGLLSGGVGLATNLSSMAATNAFYVGLSAKIVTNVMKETSYQLKHKQLTTELTDSKTWLVEESDRLQQEFDTIKQVWLAHLLETMNSTDIPEQKKEQLLAISKMQLSSLTQKYQKELDTLRTATGSKAAELQKTESARRITRINDVADTVISVGAHFYPPLLLGLIVTSGVELGMQFGGEQYIEATAKANHGLRTSSILVLGDNSQMEKAVDQMRQVKNITLALAPKVLSPGMTSFRQQAKINDIVDGSKGQAQVALRMVHQLADINKDTSLKQLKTLASDWQENQQWLDAILDRMDEVYGDKAQPEIVNLKAIQQQLQAQVKTIIQRIDNYAITTDSTDSTLISAIELKKSLQAKLDDRSSILYRQQPHVTSEQKFGVLELNQQALSRDLKKCFHIIHHLSYDQSITNHQQVIAEFQQRYQQLVSNYKQQNLAIPEELATLNKKITRLDDILSFFGQELISKAHSKSEITTKIAAMNANFYLENTPGVISKDRIDNFHQKIEGLNGQLATLKEQRNNLEQQLIKQHPQHHSPVLSTALNIEKSLEKIKQQILIVSSKKKYLLRNKPTGYHPDLLKLSKNIHDIDKKLTPLYLKKQAADTKLGEKEASLAKTNGQIAITQQLIEDYRNTPSHHISFHDDSLSRYQQELYQHYNEKERLKNDLALMIKSNKPLTTEVLHLENQRKIANKSYQEIKETHAPFEIILNRSAFGLTKTAQIEKSVKGEISKVKKSGKKSITLNYYASFNETDIRDARDAKILRDKIEGLKTELQWVNTLEKRLRGSEVRIENLTPLKNHYRQQLRHMRVAIRRNQWQTPEARFRHDTSSNFLTKAWTAFRRNLSVLGSRITNFFRQSQAKSEYNKAEALFHQLPYETHAITEITPQDSNNKVVEISAFNKIPKEGKFMIKPSLYIASVDLVYASGKDANKALINTILSEFSWVKRVEKSNITIENGSDLHDYYAKQLIKLYAYSHLTPKEKSQFEQQVKQLTSDDFINKFNDPTDSVNVKKSIKTIQAAKREIISIKSQKALEISDNRNTPHLMDLQLLDNQLKLQLNKLHDLAPEDPELVEYIVKGLLPSFSEHERDLVFEVFEEDMLETSHDSTFNVSQALVSHSTDASNYQLPKTLSSTKELLSSLQQTKEPEPKPSSVTKDDSYLPSPSFHL